MLAQKVFREDKLSTFSLYFCPNADGMLKKYSKLYFLLKRGFMLRERNEYFVDGVYNMLREIVFILKNLYTNFLYKNNPGGFIFKFK